MTTRQQQAASTLEKLTAEANSLVNRGAEAGRRLSLLSNATLFGAFGFSGAGLAAYAVVTPLAAMSFALLGPLAMAAAAPACVLLWRVAEQLRSLPRLAVARQIEHKEEIIQRLLQHQATAGLSKKVKDELDSQLAENIRGLGALGAALPAPDAVKLIEGPKPAKE